VKRRAYARRFAFQDSTRGSDAVAPCLPAPLTLSGDATILPS